MDQDEQKFIQMAMKHLKKGAFTKQAKAHGETPMEFKKEVLAHPEKHTETTRKRAQFMENIEHKEAPKAADPPASAEKAKKAKRAPTAWNQLVTKHYAMVKGEPDAFKKAIAMAKKEKETGKEHKPIENPKSPNPKKEVMSKKKQQLHLTESDDS